MTQSARVEPNTSRDRDSPRDTSRLSRSLNESGSIPVFGADRAELYRTVDSGKPRADLNDSVRSDDSQLSQRLIMFLIRKT